MEAAPTPADTLGLEAPARETPRTGFGVPLDSLDLPADSLRLGLPLRELRS